jgi:hypothetical protein
MTRLYSFPMHKLFERGYPMSASVEFWILGTSYEYLVEYQFQVLSGYSYAVIEAMTLGMWTSFDEQAYAYTGCTGRNV